MVPDCKVKFIAGWTPIEAKEIGFAHMPALSAQCLTSDTPIYRILEPIQLPMESGMSMRFP
jgi:hypothetical protein